MRKTSLLLIAELTRVSTGGPAGCVTAGRLARADPNLQVLLVEAGASNHEGSSSALLSIAVADLCAQILESTGLEFVSVLASSGNMTLNKVLLSTDVKNMQNDGINEKATFYVDTKESSHLRGRKSIVPFVRSSILS